RRSRSNKLFAFRHRSQFEDANGGMNRRHQQRGRNSLPTDIADGNAQPFVSQSDEIVVITAYCARGLADAVQFERVKPLGIAWEELRLHFLRDGEFAFEALLFLLLLQQPLQRFRHGVERGFKRRKLISGLHANAVDQVSAIDVLSGAIQCAHRSRDCSREPHANNQRYQFDNRECDRNHHQQYENRRTYLSQIGKDAAVQNRWASAYVHRRASLFSRTPLDGGKYRSKLQHGIEPVNLRRSYSTAYRRHRSHIFVIAFAELEGSLTIF